MLQRNSLTNSSVIIIDLIMNQTQTLEFTSSSKFQNYGEF